MSFNHMLPSFDLKKSFDPILCNFQVNYNRRREEQKKSERRNEETEKKLCRIAQNQSMLA